MWIEDNNEAAYWVRTEMDQKTGELRLALIALQDEVKALRAEYRLINLSLQVALTALADLKEEKK
jgi:hypothetical protein